MLALILFCKWREVKKLRDNCQMDRIICKSMPSRRHTRFYICFVYNVLVGLDRTQLVLNNWRKKQGLHLHYLPCMYVTRKLYQGSPGNCKKCQSLRRPGLLKAGYWMDVQPHWPLFYFKKDLTVKG